MVTFFKLKRATITVFVQETIQSYPDLHYSLFSHIFFFKYYYRNITFFPHARVSIQKWYILLLTIWFERVIKQPG